MRAQSASNPIVRTALAVLLCGAALSPVVASAQTCAGFTDVPAADDFCPNVEWLKNRKITLGCASDQYCPTQPVIRLAMAAFMNRLGTALTPVQVRSEAFPGAIDLDTSPVVCMTTPFVVADYPRRVYLDGNVSVMASADVGLAADLVATTDGGTTWVAVNTFANRGSTATNQYSVIADIGHADLAVGETVRWGLRMSRGGIAGSADLTDSRCQVRALVYNRNGDTSPL